MNQFYAANREIDYPLKQLPSRPQAEREWLADLVVRLSRQADPFAAGTSIRLTQISGAPGNTEIVFTISGGPLNGWTLETPVTAVQDFIRLPLALYDTSSAPRPDLGYGYVVIGYASSLVDGSYALDVADSTTRLLEAAAGMRIRVGNTTEQTDTQRSEVPGSGETISFRGWVEQTIPGCVEIGVYPAGHPSAGDPKTQVEIDPPCDGTTTTTGSVDTSVADTTELEPGDITTLIVTGVEITDSLVSTTHDAVIDPQSPVESPEFLEGRNIRLSGSIEPAEIEINFSLGAGLGFSCDPIPGVGLKAGDVVKSVMGVHGPHISFVGGPRVDIIASPGDHRIYFVFQAERLNSVS